MSYTDFDFPHTSLYTSDLRELIANLRRIEDIVKTFVNTEQINFADPIIWNITSQYAKATVVLNTSGNAYLSKQAVPSGIQLNNEEYWQEIFNFTDYTRTANQNLTINEERNTTRATHNYAVDDWLIWNDVLYKVTSPIAVDDILVVGTNLVHFTVEEFLKAFITYATSLINQYKDDIDASELAYRQQLAQDIANTTASLQAQLNAAIAGATVDSEVINARVGWDNTTYSTLRESIISQIEECLNNITFTNKSIEKNLDGENVAIPSRALNRTGALISSSTSKVTPFLYILNDSSDIIIRHTAQGNNETPICFYDEELNFTGNALYGSNENHIYEMTIATADIPSGSKYAKVTVLNAYQYEFDNLAFYNQDYDFTSDNAKNTDKLCNIYSGNNDIIANSALNRLGQVIVSSSSHISQYMTILDNAKDICVTHTFQGNQGTPMCFYDEYYNFISNALVDTNSNDILMMIVKAADIPTDAKYVRITLLDNHSHSFKNLVVNAKGIDECVDTSLKVNKGQSFFDAYNNIVSGSGLTRTGEKTYSSTTYISKYYMICDKSKDVMITHAMQGNAATPAIFYDKYYEVIGNYVLGTNLNDIEHFIIPSTDIPANAVYVRFTNVNNMAIETRNLIIAPSFDFDIIKLNANGSDPLQLAGSCAARMTSIGVKSQSRLVIAHLTDIHMDIERYRNFCKICDKDLISYGIVTGDYVNNYSDSFSDFITETLATSKRVYPVIGNHEMRGYTGSDLQTELLAKYITPITANTHVSSLYYYKDISLSGGYNTRLIVLNQFDYSGAGLDLSDAKCYMSQTQVDWLLNVLDDAISNDMIVILAYHEKEEYTIYNRKAFYQTVSGRLNSKGDLYYVGSMIDDIINAFKNGTTIDETYETVNDLPDIVINHTFANQGKFAAHLNGHGHGDYIGYTKKYSDQLYLNGNVGSAITALALESSDLPRSLDDSTQDCFNIYVFDFDSNVVFVIRYGSNLTNTLRPRKIEYYNI